MLMKTQVEEIEINGKNAVWGYLQISIMCAACFVHYHRWKFGYIYIVFLEELKQLTTFILLSQTGKCGIGVTPGRTEQTDAPHR